jgi:hypothetical protein
MEDWSKGSPVVFSSDRSKGTENARGIEPFMGVLINQCENSGFLSG